MSIQTINRMTDWVDGNLTGHPTLTGMASHVGYSPFYCSTKFREHMGMTFKQYLAVCRLRAAANDILHTEDKIIDIAFRYGYASPESLSRAVCAAYGRSPRQLRGTREK